MRTNHLVLSVTLFMDDTDIATTHVILFYQLMRLYHYNKYVYLKRLIIVYLQLLLHYLASQCIEIKS